MEFIDRRNSSVDWITKIEFWDFQKYLTITKNSPHPPPQKNQQKTTKKQKIIEKENSSAKIVLITICLI